MGPRSIPGVGERGGEGLASVGAPPPQRSECCPFASLTIRSILVSEVGDKLPRSFTLELRERAFSETSSLVGVFHAWFSSRESAPFSSTAAAERQKEERSHGGSVLVAQSPGSRTRSPQDSIFHLTSSLFPLLLGRSGALAGLASHDGLVAPPLRSLPEAFRFRCRPSSFPGSSRRARTSAIRVLGGENVQKNLKILTLGKVWRHFPIWKYWNTILAQRKAWQLGGWKSGTEGTGLARREKTSMPERENVRERLLRSGGTRSDGVSSSPLLDGNQQLDLDSDGEQENVEPKKFSVGELVCLFFIGIVVVGGCVAFGLLKTYWHFSILGWISKHIF